MSIGKKPIGLIKEAITKAVTRAITRAITRAWSSSSSVGGFGGSSLISRIRGRGTWTIGYRYVFE